MGGFDAALKVGSDSRPLNTRVVVEGGRLVIISGDQQLGNWAMSELDLERVSGGFRVGVEGEELMLDVNDVLGFQEAIEANRPSRKRRRRGREPKATPSASPSPPSPSPTSSAVPTPAAGPKPATSQAKRPKPAKPAKPKREKKERDLADESFLQRSLATLDGWLEKGKLASGSDWPDWIFSRWTVGGLLALVIFAIVFPGMFSTFFLLGGLALVILGAVLYTDDAMARRWLPGRLTALHVLIGGTGLAVLGVLVAVVRG